MNLKRYVSAELQEMRKGLSEELESVETAIALLDSGAKPIYFCEIRSLWEDHGEVGVSASNLSVAKAIDEAETSFMKANKRTDVQGRYSVWGMIGNQKILMPDYKKLKKSDE